MTRAVTASPHAVAARWRALAGAPSRTAFLAVAAVLAVSLGAGALVSADRAPAAAGETRTLSMLGADVSSLQRSLDLGVRYRDAAGRVRDPLDLLSEAGVGWVRLRVWNRPGSPHNTREALLRQARWATAHGFRVLVDLHYSDTWADPAAQRPPRAWLGHDLPRLRRDVRRWTSSVCQALVAQGTPPDAVQLGNEINTGMLWDVGRVEGNDFRPLASLLQAGRSAVKDCSPGTAVMIHTAYSDSVARARWFYDGLRRAGLSWDLTGLSYYCAWHGTLDTMGAVVADLRRRYGHDVVIVETAFPYTSANADDEPNAVPGRHTCDGFRPTPAGQARGFTAVQDVARAAGASGVFYWEPTWTAVPGNGWNPADPAGSGNPWDNMAIFDSRGRVNPRVRWVP